MLGVTATKKLTIYSINERKDEIGNDEGYVKNIAVSAVVDGSSPWDGDDAPGDDSSDSNKIVRTWDTVTYNVAYTTATYELGTSYDNAYVNFCFTLPMEEQEASFDTDAMGWMSTDPQHMWKKQIKQDDLGKNYQVLTCSKRISNQGSSTSAVPGSGEVYVQITVYAAKNKDKIEPSVKAYMDGNKLPNGDAICGSSELLANNISNNVNCATHNKNELIGTMLDQVTVSAAPSYNLFIQRSDYSSETSGIFDFSTGDDDAPNKDAGSIRGRLVRYTVSMELRNKVIQSGSDKGKSKYLRGIEIPKSDITYTVDMSSIFLSNSGKTYNLDAYDEYKPLLWATSKNTNNLKYRSELHSVSTTATGIPYDCYYNRTIAKSGFASPFSRDSNGVTLGTNNVWNGGTALKASQSGRKLTLTQSGYEINPKWFPNCDAWSNQNSTKYFNPAGGTMKTNRAIFSCASLYIVVPYGNGDDYLPNKYNCDGTERLTLKDGALNSVSISGQKLLPVSDSSNQSVTTDDKLTDTVYLTRPGNWGNFIWYSSKNNPCQWYGSGGTGDTYNQYRGSDSVAIGDQVGVYWGFIQYANGEMKNIEQANDVLLKFDDKAFTVTQRVPRATNNIAFAAKKDGTGWTSDDEMNKTNIEDLFYYDDYDKLIADGKKCVGVLSSYRNPQSTYAGQDIEHSACLFRATTDTRMDGYVAQMVVESNAWHLYTETSDGALKTNAQVPSILDVQNGRASLSEYHTDFQYIKNLKEDYVKSEYDIGGNLHEHTSGFTIGDSVRLVSYKSKVNVSTAQYDESGNRKKIYDLDNNQYTIDYEIKPTAEIVPGTNIDLKSTLLLKATIPAGLEYIPESSYFGGEYKQSSPVGYPGNKTGKSVTPEITKNANGTTTLAYQIAGVSIEEELPSLFFSCQIDSMTKRNADFQVTASIQTTEDKRHITAMNQNFSTCSVKTSKTTDISLKTATINSMNDANAEIGWELSWSNNASNALYDQTMLSIMPCNGDASGSSYHGNYIINSINIENIIPEQYEIWYTTSPSGTSLSTNDDSGVTGDAIRTGKTGDVTWNKAKIDANGTVVGIPSGGVTAWCIIGTIPGSGSVNATVTIKPSENTSGDRYVNTIWLTNSTTQASAYIVRRMINGVTWIDWNANGKHDSDERPLSGVRVSLVNEETNTTITNLDGKQCVTITRDDGTYSFDKIPEGNVKVCFDDGGTDFSKYRQSYPHVMGLDASVDNDATGSYDNNGRLIIGSTQAIRMPATSELTSTPYIIQNVDAGYVPIVTLPLSGGNAIRLGVLSVAAFCMSAGVAAFVLGLRYGERALAEKGKSGIH